jgi:hypothetical protein
MLVTSTILVFTALLSILILFEVVYNGSPTYIHLGS